MGQASEVLGGLTHLPVLVVERTRERGVDLGAGERREREHGAAPDGGRSVGARRGSRAAPSGRRGRRAPRPRLRVRSGRGASSGDAREACHRAVDRRGRCPSSPSAHAAASTTVTSRSSSAGPVSRRRRRRASPGASSAPRRRTAGSGVGTCDAPTRRAHHPTGLRGRARPARRREPGHRRRASTASRDCDVVARQVRSCPSDASSAARATGPGRLTEACR